MNRKIENVKIAIVAPYFYPTMGGAEKYCFNLANELSRQSINVTVVTSDQFYKTNSSPYDFPIVYIPWRSVYGVLVPTGRLLPVLKEISPDMVHASGPGPYSLLTGLFCKRLGMADVLMYHAGFHPDSRIKAALAKLEQPLENYLLRLAFDAVIVHSDYYKNKLARFLRKDRIKVIPPGIDNGFFNLDSRLDREECLKELEPKGVRHVLFVGILDRNHYYKGVNTLIEAAKSVNNGIHFIIVGDGDRRNYYEGLAVTEGVRDNFTFAGFVEQEKLFKYYRIADLLVLPSNSDSEGYGYVLFEAMAAGVAVVTTRKVGSSELLARCKIGTVVPENQPVALADSINKLLDDTELRQSLVSRGKDFVRGLTWQNMAEATLSLYQSLP